MKPYDFVSLPRPSSVAGAVTMLTSAWFVLAGGAILTDQHSEHTVESARPAAVVAEAPAWAVTPVSHVVPDARFTIVVEGRRSASL